MKNRIILNNLISCITAVVLTAVVCVMTYGHFISLSMISQAENQAYVLKEICLNSQNPTHALEDIKDSFKSRVTLVDFEGNVIFDSVYDSETLENHLDRREIQEAVQNGFSSGERYSQTDKTTNYYHTLKIDGVGIIRVSVHARLFILDGIFPNLPVMVLCAIAVIVIVYKISVKTTASIVKTIENYDFQGEDGEVYEELYPFIKKIEDQQKTIKNQISKTEAEKEKLASVFSNMEESIIVCDEFKNIIQVNKKAAEIFNAKENTKLLEAFRFHRLSKDIDRALKGEIVHGILEKETSIFQYTISPNIQNGENNGAILIFLDITKQEENQKARRQFTANVTHELKTPLTSILGYSQLITNGIAKPEDITKFGVIIEKNAQFLLQLIDDIMQISSLEEKTSMEMSLVNLKSIICDILNDLSPVISDKNISVLSQMEDVSLQANHKYMGDLCRNLISNAVKYNKDGGKIFVNLSSDGKNCTLKVRDTGIGISQEDLPKIFQRFYVADKSRNKHISSTGLGLSIVKHIVTSMNGEIKVDSVLGEGSEFTAVLPLVQSE